MRDKPKTTPRTQRFLSKRRSTIIAWLSWEDSDDSDSQTHQPSTVKQFPVTNMRVSMVTERKGARSTMQNRHITLNVMTCTDTWDHWHCVLTAALMTFNPCCGSRLSHAKFCKRSPHTFAVPTIHWSNSRTQKDWWIGKLHVIRKRCFVSLLAGCRQR